ncbi:CPBP family intramembrane metalloprotease [Halobacteriales archaeon QS_1_68_20]|nr:MAG: CPBP family intramembrane metalloprotease [Halobacteriales archaeon QS_1_68_20]
MSSRLQGRVDAVVAQFPLRVDRRTWLVRTALLGAAVLLIRRQLTVGDLPERAVVETMLYVVGPLALGLTHGRQLGWRVDRRAVKHTVALALFVLPFYVVGSSLPTIRSYYPIWRTTLTPTEFLPHAAGLFVLALATETYYRGLLCVGIKHIGFKAVFVSPIVYQLMHAGKPAIEFWLSGPTDVLFGAVDYRSDSILPSVVAHGGGLILLDWLVLHDPLLPPERIVDWLSWLPIPV